MRDDEIVQIEWSLPLQLPHLVSATSSVAHSEHRVVVILLPSLPRLVLVFCCRDTLVG